MSYDIFTIVIIDLMIIGITSFPNTLKFGRICDLMSLQSYAYDSLIMLMYLDFVLIVLYDAPKFPANEDMGHK